MHDVVEFLQRHPPFEELTEDELDELGKSVEVEFFPAGDVIFRQGEEPMQHLRVVRRGAVELVDRGRVLDRLGEGELFGHPSMLSGQPTGFEARAGEDALCYRLPAEAVLPLLARPAGVRFVARSLLAHPRPDPASRAANVDPAQQPVAKLVRAEPVICEPDDSLREAARRMTRSPDGAALVRLGEGEFGIVTNADLRNVVAEAKPVDAPVTEAMTTPVFSVSPDRFGGEVMLEMLRRGVRHAPVISPLGDVIGVLSDVDLLAAQTQTPFAVRRSIDEAASLEELQEAAARLHPTVVALQDARVASMQICAIVSIVADALTTRFVELSVEDLGVPPCPLSWLALGSLGRRELMPSSDIDSALAWEGDGGDETLRSYVRKLAEGVTEQLAAAGFASDTHGATAANPLFERSVESWQELISNSIEHPDENKGLVVISLLIDGRKVYGFGDARDPLEYVLAAHSRRSVLRLMLKAALVHRPPTGFLREFVVEHSGEHRGRLDIKHGGVLPVTSIARYSSLAAGARVTSTPERLRTAGTAGILEPGVARTLEEAFELFSGLRLEHQVEQIRRGVEPDNFIDPEALNPLTRRYLRDAFSEVRAVQKRLGAELGTEATFG